MHDRYEYKDDNVSFHFPYCDSPKEQLFWKSHIEEYQHLYVYVFLYYWREKSSSQLIIKRFESYTNFHKNDIINQINKFLNANIVIPSNIFVPFAFIVDEYLWSNLTLPPQGYAFINDGKSRHELYHKYVGLFTRAIEPLSKSDLCNNINLFLSYCEVIDKKGESTDCFRILVNKLLSHDSVLEISEALIVITKPLEGHNKNRFNFALLKALLDFCCKYRNVYDIDSNTIEKIIYNIVCNRIKEYVYCYHLFINKKLCIEFFNERCAPFYLTFYMTEKDVLLWQQKVFPWNIVDYYFEDGLKSLNTIFNELNDNLHNECVVIINNLIKQARKQSEKYGGIRGWMKRNLKEHTEKHLLEKKKLLKERLINHLSSYKADTCFKIVRHAINDVCTTDNTKQIIEKSGLEEHLSVEYEENLNITPKQDKLYSTISIKSGNNVLFSVTMDRSEAPHYFDTMRSLLSPQYYEIVSKAWISENIFGGSTKIKDNISNDKEKEYKEFITTYKKTLKTECALFIRNYLDYEYVVYREKKMKIETAETSNDSIWDDKDYTDNWLWDHGF